MKGASMLKPLKLTSFSLLTQQQHCYNFSSSSCSEDSESDSSSSTDEKKTLSGIKRMSWKAWLVLLVLYVGYLFIGGYSFRALEYPDDCEKKMRSAERRREVVEEIIAFADRLSPKEESQHFLSLIRDIDPDLVTPTIGDFDAALLTGNDTDVPEELCAKWSLYNSVFFSFTAVTTIGYGHIYPSTDEGKILCIFYSLLGVPINGILIGTLGSFFADAVKSLLKWFTGDSSEHRDSIRYLIIFRDFLLFLVPGAIVFLVAPSFAFWSLEEDWTYLDSFYYAFITLTTIGFGDYVAGRDLAVLDRMGNWAEFYQACLMIWITFGLGYVFMLIAIIAEGLQKPARSAAKRFKARRRMAMGKVVEELTKMKEEEARRNSITSVVSSRLGSEPSCLERGADEADDAAAVEGATSTLRRARSENALESAVTSSELGRNTGSGETTLTDVNDDGSTLKLERQTILSLKNFVDEYIQQQADLDAHQLQQPSSTTTSQPPPPKTRRSVSVLHPVDMVTRQLQRGGGNRSPREEQQPPLPLLDMELLKTTTMADFIQAVQKVERQNSDSEEPKLLRKKSSLLVIPASMLPSRGRSQSTAEAPRSRAFSEEEEGRVGRSAPVSENGETERSRL